MEISLLGFALGLLLLAIPLYVVWTVDTRRMRRLLVSLGRMALMVGALGGLIHLLMRWNSVPLTLLAGVAVLLASAAITVRHARLGMARLLLPVVVGTLPAVLFVSLYMVFLVLGQRQVFDTRLFIPVLALVIGGIIGLNARGLHTYYMGLQHHAQLYHYLLGNGGTHREALRHFVRRSFQAALYPLLKQMSGMVTLSAPSLLLALVLAGVDVGTAVAFQLLLFVAVLAASTASLWITLEIGRRYGFDDYGRLRPVSSGVPAGPAGPTAAPQTGPDERQTSAAAPAEASLSSPSAPLHTDSESRPPAQ